MLCSYVGIYVVVDGLLQQNRPTVEVVNQRPVVDRDRLPTPHVSDTSSQSQHSVSFSLLSI